LPDYFDEEFEEYLQNEEEDPDFTWHNEIIGVWS
jgi:hypothetical protein